MAVPRMTVAVFSSTPAGPREAPAAIVQRYGPAYRKKAPADAALKGNYMDFTFLFVKSRTAVTVNPAARKGGFWSAVNDTGPERRIQA